MKRAVLLTIAVLLVFAPIGLYEAAAQEPEAAFDAVGAAEIPNNRDDPRFDARNLLHPGLPGPGFCLLGFFCELDPRKMPAVSLGYRIANFAFSFIGIILVLIILYGGFRMLTSLGNPEGFKAGKDAVVAAVIGFILLTFAYVAVRAFITLS